MPHKRMMYWVFLRTMLQYFIVCTNYSQYCPCQRQTLAYLQVDNPASDSTLFRTIFGTPVLDLIKWHQHKSVADIWAVNPLIKPLICSFRFLFMLVGLSFWRAKEKIVRDWVGYLRSRWRDMCKQNSIACARIAIRSNGLQFVPTVCNSFPRFVIRSHGL